VCAALRAVRAWLGASGRVGVSLRRVAVSSAVEHPDRDPLGGADVPGHPQRPDPSGVGGGLWVWQEPPRALPGRAGADPQAGAPSAPWAGGCAHPRSSPRLYRREPL
jgi:hypothetical protein